MVLTTGRDSPGITSISRSVGRGADQRGKYGTLVLCPIVVEVVPGRYYN